MELQGKEKDENHNYSRLKAIYMLYQNGGLDAFSNNVTEQK